MKARALAGFLLVILVYAPQVFATISQITLPHQVVGTIGVFFTLSRPDSLPMDVAVQVSVDSGPFRSARTTGGTVSLATTPAGVEHFISWDSFRDLGFHGTTGTLRFAATRSDNGKEGSSEDVQVTINRIAHLRMALAQVKYYMVDYGVWSDPNKVALARSYDLVILHPMRDGITRDTVLSIEQGLDPADPADDVIVLGYISIGEDLRTVGYTDAQLANDVRFTGNRLGPRIDPRGYVNGGTMPVRSLSGIDPMGTPSTGGLGYWSFYLDDNDVDNSASHKGDGKPDRNRIFGGTFVNAGDPNWFEVLQQMSADGPDRLPGFREIMTGSYGRSLNMDGVFLDTVDTCAPSAYTDSSSPNQSEFEWTAPGYLNFITNLRASYSNKLLLQNRGVFFFDPRKDHFRYTTRPVIDLNMYESFYLDSDTSHISDPFFYPDNRYNVAPKLMAEANRPDGFVPLSLDYAKDTNGMAQATLTGGSTLGAEILRSCVAITSGIGFLPYLSDPPVALANAFAKNNMVASDTEIPQWTSSYNEHDLAFPSPPGAPSPRVGIQAASVTGPGQIAVSWDVAFARSPVQYALYLQTAPFDFAADVRLRNAARVALKRQMGFGYQTGTGVTASTVAHQAVVSVVPGSTYYLCIRAFDESANMNEELNTMWTSVAV